MFNGVLYISSYDGIGRHGYAVVVDSFWQMTNGCLEIWAEFGVMAVPSHDPLAPF